MSVHCPLGLVAVCWVAVLVSVSPPVPRESRSQQDALREIARVRHHLAGAEEVLVSREVSALTAAQRAARAHHVAGLRAYRQRGVFPHNHGPRGPRTPVFVDEHGTRCAMAYLIECSGEKDLVSRIARSCNLARIRDLANDPALVVWLDRNGLTLDEAARIQPEYGGTIDEPSTSAGVWVATAVGAGASGTGIGLNASIGSSQRKRNTRGLLGVACGAIGAGLGVPGLSAGGAAGLVGSIDIAMGLVSFGLGIRQLNARGEFGPRSSAHSIVPVAWCDARGTRRVGLSMRF